MPPLPQPNTHPFLPLTGARKPPNFRLVGKRRASNPLWDYNRPRHWNVRKNRFYFAAMAMGVGLAAAVDIGAVLTRPWSGGFFTIFVADVTLQIVLGIALIRWFDFVQERRRLLEDLWTTPLTIEEIAHGTFHIGVWSSLALFWALLGVEVAAAVLASEPDGVLIFVILVFAPWRYLLQCAVAESTIDTGSRCDDRLSTRKAFSLFRILRRAGSHWAPYFIAICFIRAVTLIRIDVVTILSLVLVFVLLIWYAWYFGRDTLERAYSTAAINYRAALEGNPGRPGAE